MKTDRKCIALIAPAARLSFGEAFGLPPDGNYTKQLCRLLRKIGFQKIYDVNNGADETTIVDTEELLEHKKQGKYTFTSCCPGWVNFMETRYPELIPFMSTAKSCVEILGQLVRKHEPDAFIVEIMPCTAKKIERKRDNNIDAAITVVEITDYLKELRYTKEDLQVE